MSEVPSLRSKNLLVDEAEWQRCKRLILLKARRYKRDTVEVSDRLVVGMSPQQLAQLVTELAEEGVTVDWKRHAGYGAELSRVASDGPRRLGSHPNNHGERHPKGPDWANG